MVICQTCKGRGTVAISSDEDDRAICPSCEGSGKVENLYEDHLD